jgi:hypothetical protein
MSPEKQPDPIDDIVAAMTGSPRHIQARKIGRSLETDPAYGTGVANGLGIDLTPHDTCVAPKHENTGVMKGSPHPAPPPSGGEGEKERLRRFSR